MNDRDVRDFLQHMAGEEPVPFLDAEPLIRRARRRAARTVVVGALGVAAAIALVFAGVTTIRSMPIPANDPTPAPAPAEDLGIFAPVAGRIVYGDGTGIWGIDPSGTADPAARAQLSTEPGIPLGWSSDGRHLLIMQTIRREQVVAEGAGRLRLSVLHADGSQTQVAELGQWIPGATISPDGSRVVFATYKALYSVDVGGGRPVLLRERGEDAVYAPTFSPDGAEIAYVVGSGDHSHRVWVMNADGSDAHEILANETTRGSGHVLGLTWSPDGGRIAFGNDVDTYTFAPDGSGFTRVLANGTEPHWSPDGSRFAYSDATICPESGSYCNLAIADADGSNAHVLGSGTSGPWHPGASATEPASTADSPTPPFPAASRSGALAYWNDGDVYVADADGANALRIADGVPDDGSSSGCDDGEQRAEYGVAGTAWSPDGRYLAYWDYGCPVPQGAWATVLISDVQGNVVASFPGEGWSISWSPDSTRVAVMDNWGEGDPTIGVYGLDGIRQTTLTVPSDLTPSGDYSPVWSRDGTSILLPGVQVPLDGDGPTTFPDEFYYGVYSPDGSRFAYFHDGSLVVDDVGVPDAQKAGGALEFWEVAWSPKGDLVAFAADETELLVRDVATGADTSLVEGTQSETLSVIEFSPDGDRVLFTRWDPDRDRSSLWSVGSDGSHPRLLVARVDGADLQPQGRPS